MTVAAAEGTAAWVAAHDAPVDDADRHFLIQAVYLLEAACVHLPDRRAAGIDPLAALQRLRARPPARRAALFAALLAIFARFGDRHTRCVLPAPWANDFAWLPLTVAACDIAGGPALLVTRSDLPGLLPGDRIVAWNGRPVAAAIAAHARRQLGANRAARVAKAVQTLTLRPLALLSPPPGPVVLTWTGAAGERTARLDWRAGEAATLAATFGAAQAEPEPGPAMRRIATAAGTIGWIRVGSLRTPPDVFAARLHAVVGHDAPESLVLDLRGCEEGFVPTGERLLGLFGGVARPRFEVRATAWMRGTVARHSALTAWRPAMAAAAGGFSASRALGEGTRLTAARYGGRLAVVVDALTYSTAEMVAAGIQDDGLGPVVGVAPATGGGGAIAWSQPQLHALSGDDAVRPDPATAALRVAAMRCRRSGRHRGRLIEGDGVRPDLLHRATRRDLFEDDADLVARIAGLFARPAAAWAWRG